MTMFASSDWASRFPTLYMLDICAVSATKLSQSQIAKDPRKVELVSMLRTMDRPQHCISYICTLMEKVADADADEELEHKILDDVNALRAFFKCAHVLESDEFLVSYLRELKNEAPELDQPNYLQFLEQVNSKHMLRNPVSVKKRYQKAEVLLHEADMLSISRQHPVVLITLACLYRNAFAIRLMKFKAQVRQFKAANALADIMAIVRAAKFKFMIERDARNQGQLLRTQYVTGDEGLRGMIKSFEPTSVKDEVLNDVVRSHFQFGVNDQLLTELVDTPEELQRILDLVFKHNPQAHSRAP